ncbi:MAG TPA: hypothetical protein PK674_03485 [Candidatus Absconditabacterales bacterium]|nr:hypothetical protein [Candidatus Absconditabacterales bacterium]HOQ79313.1 hypothetical protein [Candidatus Absconditabacterales bacterium]
MKFFFVAEDSLYKIFKTLEKIPKGKSIEISIDSQHSLFDNERWGKQIKEILDKKSIKATFVTKTETTRRFFEKIGLKTKHIEKNKFMKYLRIIYLFFFDIKKFHLNTFQNRKSYTFILVIGFEVLFVLGIMYLIYSLIIPGARIEINPSQQIETIIYNFRYYPFEDQDYPRYSRFLSVPYYTGSLDYRYNMSMNASNVKFLQNPSVGEIKIFNKTEKQYALVPNTRFITEDGRLFQTTNRIEIPAGYQGVPGELIIRVKAMDKDDNDILMGDRGNIAKGTTLYIKNLKQSLFLKEIYAVALEDFTGGTITSDGKVTQKDIDILSEKMVSYISQQKKNIVSQNFNIKDSLLLAFNDTISTTIKKIEVPHEVGENTSLLNGYVDISFSFFYIKWSDLIRAFSEYIAQRPSNKTQLVSINKNSLVFFEEDGLTEKNSTFIIPTKIEITQGYDFKKDVVGIVDDIKTYIVGGDKETARNYILGFPEVASVKIKITPAWYNSIPKLRSRIRVNVQN